MLGASNVCDGRNFIVLHHVHVGHRAYDLGCWNGWSLWKKDDQRSSLVEDRRPFFELSLGAIFYSQPFTCGPLNEKLRSYNLVKIFGVTLSMMGPITLIIRINCGSSWVRGSGFCNSSLVENNLIFCFGVWSWACWTSFIQRCCSCQWCSV